MSTTAPGWHAQQGRRAGRLAQPLRIELGLGREGLLQGETDKAPYRPAVAAASADAPTVACIPRKEKHAVSPLEMSLGDVALLTRVQRPVASVWRSRSIGSPLPFPEPVRQVGGEDRFDAESVVAWLEQTGRGNHNDVRADVANFATPPDVVLHGDELAYAGLTALLCLKAMTDPALAGLDDRALIELARSVDPTDELLVSEIIELGGRRAPLAEYADLLAEAAFGPAEALDRLLDQRFRLGQRGLISVAVAAPAAELVVVLARALARECGSEPPVYVEAAGSAGDLVLAVARADVDLGAEVVQLGEGGRASRLLSRRLRTREITVTSARSAAGAGPAVLIAHHTADGTGSSARGAALDAVDEISLTLTADQRAIVVAPAALLVDRLREPSLQELRGRVLRTGRVRALVRLPAGLVPHRSREALALWVLGPDQTGQDVEDRRVAIIDVSDAPLTRLVSDQVRDDVLAALAPPALARAHSYALARWVPTSFVLAQRGSLVPPSTRTPRAGLDGAAVALLLEDLRRGVAGPDLLGGLGIEPGRDAAAPPFAVAEAVRRGLLRVLPGNREGFDLVPDGGVPVLGVDELFGHSLRGARRLDRLAFLGGHRPGRLTEPGDVVFGTSPRPRAAVDAAGGSAVEAPARVLRIEASYGEGLSPYVLASAINAQPETSRSWRDWLLPQVARAQTQLASRALQALEQEQERLRTRLGHLDVLRDALVQGLSAGALALHYRTCQHDNDKDD